MTLIILGKANTLSQQLAEKQIELRGVIPSGPPIRWDNRVDLHSDCLADTGNAGSGGQEQIS